MRVEFRKERRGSLNFKIPIKYRTETIRAGIRAVGKKGDTSCRAGSRLSERSPEKCRCGVYIQVYNARGAESRLGSCERGVSRRRDRTTVADTSDVMRRNFANKQIRRPSARMARDTQNTRLE